MSLSYIVNLVGASLAKTAILFLIWGFVRYLIIMSKIKSQAFNRKKELGLWIFVFYIIFLFQITVYRYGIDWSSIAQRTNLSRNINLIPFIEIIAVYKYGTTWAFIYNFIGNIAWFVPLGVLVPYLRDNISPFQTIIVGFCVSTSIEIMQLIFNTGLCDIDDIIINVLGTATGYLLYIVVKCLRKRIKTY